MQASHLLKKKTREVYLKSSLFASESFPCELIEHSLKPTSLREISISEYHKTV